MSETSPSSALLPAATPPFEGRDERLSEPDADTRKQMFEGEIRAGLTAQ